VINIGSRTGHKFGILLVLTTLAIGSAAGLSWESSTPSNGATVSGTVTLNFTDTADNGSTGYTFHYRASGNSNWQSASGTYDLSRIHN